MILECEIFSEKKSEEYFGDLGGQNPTNVNSKFMEQQAMQEDDLNVTVSLFDTAISVNHGNIDGINITNNKKRKKTVRTHLLHLIVGCLIDVIIDFYNNDNESSIFGGSEPPSMTRSQSHLFIENIDANSNNINNIKQSQINGKCWKCALKGLNTFCWVLICFFFESEL